MTKAVRVCCFASLCVPALFAQTAPFWPVPPRVLGQFADPNNPGVSKSGAPNLVEGREFSVPQGIAIDRTASILYVADTANNRVLAWRNIGASNGAPADLVLGQADLFHTDRNKPDTARGLREPAALAVDAQGNLYVLDTGNNRLLRFPKPFEQTDMPRRPDAYIGQPSASDVAANTGGRSAQSMDLTNGSVGMPGGMAFDANGGLWVTDSGNNRVLHYSKDSLDGAANSRISADIVLGQANFESGGGNSNFRELTKLNAPTSLALDSAGRIFVSDTLHRVLVFADNPPPQGATALRMLGQLSSGGQVLDPPTASSLRVPQGVAFAGDDLIVMDSGNNRILRFNPYSQWPSTDPVAAKAVAGQPDFAGKEAKAGATGLSLPMNAAWSGSDLLVADALNNRVATLPSGAGPASHVLGQVGFEYNAANLVEGREFFLASDLRIPSGATIRAGGTVAVDTKSDPPRLFISDTFNNRVLGFCDARKAKPGDTADLVIGQPNLFTTAANYNSDGTSNLNDANLNRPTGLAADPQGNLFVADWSNGRVLRFANPCSNPSGPFHANLVIGQPDFTHRNVGADSQIMGEPFGVALMPEGHLLVSDRAYNRVLLFEKPQNEGGDFTNGQRAKRVFGQTDFFSVDASNAANRMSDPRYIATDTSGRLYVADSHNRRMLVFSAVAEQTDNGPTPSITVTQGRSNESLGDTHGIYVNPANGEVWVTQPYKNQILRYPEYLSLAVNPFADLSITTWSSGMGLAIDQAGNFYLTEAANRVSLYVPPATTTNAASFLTRALAPGAYASLFGNFPGVATRAWDWEPRIPESPNMSTTLSDVQVLVSGVAAPLHFVSPSQINFLVPKDTPSSGAVDIVVQRASTQQILAAGGAVMQVAAPAFFTQSVAPFSPGQIAAINGDHARDGGLSSCNGPQAPAIPGFCPGGVRPAARGESVELYAIGQGLIPGLPDDGEPAPMSLVTTPGKPTVVFALGTSPMADPDFSGLAPGLIGVWQINVKVPSNAPPGKLGVALIYRDVPSTVSGVPATFIVVQ